MAQRTQVPMLFSGSPLARTGIDPFSIMDRLLGEMVRGGDGPRGTGETPAIMAPRIDISETASDIKVRAELPGVGSKDVEVIVTDDLLTIRGEKQIVRDEDRENFHLVERAYGSFARNIRLPFKVDPNDVDADFENGVLTVTLKKPTEAHRRTNRIEVRGAGQSDSGPSQALKDAASELRSANASQPDGGPQPENTGQAATTGSYQR